MFVSRQVRTNGAGSGRTQAPTALRFTRATISTKAVAIVTNNTTPIVNGAVIMAPSAHASGCTPAITRLDFVHLGGVGEAVGELSVNCGWGFSAVRFQPRQCNISVGQPQHEVRRFRHVSNFCTKSS